MQHISRGVDGGGGDGVGGGGGEYLGVISIAYLSMTCTKPSVELVFVFLLF